MAQNIDLSPDIVNITGYAGDSIVFKVRFVDFSPPVDATYRAHVKRAKGQAPDEVFDVVTEADGATLTLTAQQTENLANIGFSAFSGTTGGRFESASAQSQTASYSGLWDVEFIQVDGSVRTLAAGTFSLTDDVTDVNP